ncbi:hypothetical protein [Kineococcus glutinatus]|uniref:Uncharacterized protein n=1 Tax=Kineococcus glutinatus TaxID=1070872 RepID=A0ABP9H9S7_9ACTN
MSPLTPDHPDVAARRLLLRAGAPLPEDASTAAALVDRAHHRGRIRRRRRRLAWGAAGTSTVVAAAVLALALPGSGGDSRRLAPADPPATEPAATSEEFTAGGLTLPLPTLQPDDAPDRPGLEGHDWRGQIRESMRRYPDAFVVPEQLPPDIGTMQTNLYDGHPVVTVDSEGPGVVICVGDLATCQEAVSDDWPVVRSGEVGARAFHVLVSPPGKPTDTGLTARQQEYWSTVAFTSTPNWLGPNG